MKAVYARYLYKKKNTFGYLYAFRCLNSIDGHIKRINEINRQDEGKHIWKFDIININDFDYPKGG